MGRRLIGVPSPKQRQEQRQALFDEGLPGEIAAARSDFRTESGALLPNERDDRRQPPVLGPSLPAPRRTG